MMRWVLAWAMALAGLTLAGLTLAGQGAWAAPAPLATLAGVAPVRGCDSLAQVDLSAATGARTTVTATLVDGDHPYCKVTGTIAPAISYEVRLPIQGWTQRFLQTGCGGLCGNLRIDVGKAQDCAPATDGTLALASTDMGHQGNDTAWGDSQQQREDFAYRGVHATTLAAKALIRAFYGRAQQYAYFAGCSDGGREALIAAQRYPDDFDGITAGAPAMNFHVQNSFHHAWLAAANTGPDGQALLTAPDIAPLHALVLKQCDALDGLVDGQITDPRLCHVDPAPLLCRGDYEQGKCLTAAQIAVVRKVFAGARDARGRLLEAGPLMPGSELNWVGVFVPMRPGQPIFSGRIALDAINHVMFTPNPATPYTIANFPHDDAMLARLQPARALYDATNPDLSAFFAHGGKLILWHGWADPHISPLGTIDYYERVGLKLGKARRDASLRLFLFPGMGHCSGGDGPSEFPVLAAIMGWVEGGQAPGVLVAHRATQTHEGQPTAPAGQRPAGAEGPPPGMFPPQPRLSPRSRPVYAYPQVAAYAGKGSLDEAASFVARTPAPVKGLVDWVGAR
jgi:hypothetical protein